jgi:phosphatidylserine/phosphatidylglycerophosphate/cardiolipin synthase-like enzyme
MKLIIQPDDGVTPLLTAVKKARKRVDFLIFRFDRPELEKAMAAAVTRGVVVRALIAHTNRGGEKNLRKLELRLLEAGVTVARTADELPRYHGKLLIADETLHVLAFNPTRLDMEKSRSFGVSLRHRPIVQEAAKLFEADMTRQPYTPSCDKLVVSPETSRKRLTDFIKKAKKQLLIYDTKVSDPLILRLLVERAKAGVEIRVIGRVTKRGNGLQASRLGGMRLHTRAIIRDGRSAFLGSQSLRKLELDGRREVGIIIDDKGVVKRMSEVFEWDWTAAASGDETKSEKKSEKKNEKKKKKEPDKEKVERKPEKEKKAS